MKSILLVQFFTLSFLVTRAQETMMNQLPPGKYETVIKNSQARWDKGDLVLLSDQQYKLGGNAESGEYRFSAAAQKIFFTSGPLKGAVAKTSLQGNVPVILLPVNEHQNVGLRLASSDIVAVLKN